MCTDLVELVRVGTKARETARGLIVLNDLFQRGVAVEWSRRISTDAVHRGRIPTHQAVQAWFSAEHVELYRQAQAARTSPVR